MTMTMTIYCKQMNPHIISFKCTFAGLSNLTPHITKLSLYHILASCWISGDPHFMTFDHFHYSFMGSCSYTAMRTRDGLLSVSVESISCGSTGVTCTKAVTIVYNNTIISLIRGADIMVRFQHESNHRDQRVVMTTTLWSPGTPVYDPTS